MHTSLTIRLLCMVLLCGSLGMLGTAQATTPKRIPIKSIKNGKPAKRDAHKRFEQANRLYNKGEYAKAAKLFASLQRSPAWSNFVVFYNLGNCYHQLQQYGMALGYYRKAQRLQPNNEKLLHNLQLLYRQVKRSGPEDNQLRLKFLFWYYLFSLRQLYFAVLLFSALSFLLWGFHIRREAKTQKKGLRWIVALSFVILALLGSSLLLKAYREMGQQTGIVTKSSVTVRSGYGPQFEGMFLLNEADEVVIRERRRWTATVEGEQQSQEWLRIEVRSGSRTGKNNKTKALSSQVRSGWVPRHAIFIL